MLESENKSGSSSEEDHDVDETRTDGTGESSLEESVEKNDEVVENAGKIEKIKKPLYREIILACFKTTPKGIASLQKIKSYARTEYQLIDTRAIIFLKLELKRLINKEIVTNINGNGLSGSFKLVPKKPIKVKKISKPKTELITGKISRAIMTAEVYGSSTNVIEDKENIKPKTKPSLILKKITTVKEINVKKPKTTLKKETLKKDVISDLNNNNNPEPTKPGPKKLPKAKEIVVPKKTIAKKVPPKSTVVAVRKSLDKEKKKVAVARTKKKV
ncbi:unnamed protein product [Diamesa serratosioi]